MAGSNLRETRSQERVALIMEDEIGKGPESEGTRKWGEEGGALIEDRRNFRAATGQMGEDLREGIWIT